MSLSASRGRGVALQLCKNWSNKQHVPSDGMSLVGVSRGALSSRWSRPPQGSFFGHFAMFVHTLPQSSVAPVELRDWLEEGVFFLFFLRK